jgi:MoxR-like ATPase
MERQQIEETLAMLQAQAAAQQLILKALLRLQPDPMAVLELWRDIRTDAERSMPDLPSDARHSRWLAEQMQCFAEDWTAELADLAASATAPTKPARPGSKRTQRRANPSDSGDQGQTLAGT